MRRMHTRNTFRDMMVDEGLLPEDKNAKQEVMMKTKRTNRTTKNREGYVPKDKLIQDTINGLVKDFVSGNITNDLAEIAVIKDYRPCARWSFWNRLIMKANKTEDARGYNQWKAAGRTVKAGSRAFYILVPNIKTKKETDPNTGEERERKYLVGFLDGAVFRVEDTEGDALPTLEPQEPPPLLDVAIKFGLNVSYGELLDAYGSTNGRDIILATHDASVFFHELAHCAHDRILKAKGDHLVMGQDPIQECAAQLSAAVLSRLYLKDKHDQFSYNYVAHYSRIAGREAGDMVMEIVSLVEKIVKEIINGGN